MDTFLVIRLSPNATELIFLTSDPTIKLKFFVHSKKRNAPYVYPRLDLILQWCRTFTIALWVPIFPPCPLYHTLFKSLHAFVVFFVYVVFCLFVFVWFILNCCCCCCCVVALCSR